MGTPFKKICDPENSINAVRFRHGVLRLEFEMALVCQSVLARRFQPSPYPVPFTLTARVNAGKRVAKETINLTMSSVRDLNPLNQTQGRSKRKSDPKLPFPSRQHLAGRSERS